VGHLYLENQGWGLVVVVQDVGKQVSSVVVHDFGEGCDLEKHSTIVMI